MKQQKESTRNIKKREVNDWLLAQDTYTLHSRAKRKLTSEPRVYVKGIDEQWAVDLCDVTNISDYNNGFHFILTVIDVFSKWADAEPVFRKRVA